MIRIPFNETAYYNLPPINFSDEDLDYMDNFPSIHATELEYRWYRYPTANKITYHSNTDPIDFATADDDFLTIDNFWTLLPQPIKDKFIAYFTDEFFSQANNANYRGVRMYLNNPKNPGVHVHKDIYSGGGIPRQLAINIPVSANSLTSDLQLFDDELNLIHSVRYQKNTPTALNTGVFHGVVHNDHTAVRKIITMSPGELTMNEFLDLLEQGKVVR